MSNYIQNNSNRCKNVKQNKNYTCHKFQSYDLPTFGQTIKLCSPITCNVQKICCENQGKYQQYVLNQQNLYALMRRNPELFPITTYVQNMNLTPAEKRQYSNMWYRQFGTSQALPVNDNWGGFYLPGSEVPYTN